MEQRNETKEKQLQKSLTKGQEKESKLTARKCPNCKTINEVSARFCRECGEQLDASFCPNCKAQTIPGGDICEICGEWLLPGKCRFCYSSISDSEAFCPECGNPAAGFVCPECGTVSYFHFCKKCNTPLSESAFLTLEQIKQNPELQQLKELSKKLELTKLQTANHADTQTNSREAQEKAAKRAILLELEALKKSNAKTFSNSDKGITPKPLFNDADKKRLELALQRQKDLEAKEKELLNRINEQSANRTFDTPQKARCFFSAAKPAGNLVWVCNYVSYEHPSSNDCARPDLGGKWVIK